MSFMGKLGDFVSAKTHGSRFSFFLQGGARDKTLRRCGICLPRNLSFAVCQRKLAKNARQCAKKGASKSTLKLNQPRFCEKMFDDKKLSHFHLTSCLQYALSRLEVFLCLMMNILKSDDRAEDKRRVRWFGYFTLRIGI